MNEREETRATGQESGHPGDGKGRQDDVRGSGVYPVSGPLPEGDLKIKTPASMGRKKSQGSRRRNSAALVGRVKEGGQMTAALVRTLPQRETARKRIAPLLAELPRDIPLADWAVFLDDYSVLHEGEIIDIETFQPDQTSRVHVHDLPLMGVILDQGNQETTASIMVGKKAANHITHVIHRVSRVTATSEEILEIESADRSRTVVRCSKSPPAG